MKGGTAVDTGGRTGPRVVVVPPVVVSGMIDPPESLTADASSSGSSSSVLSIRLEEFLGSSAAHQRFSARSASDGGRGSPVDGSRRTGEGFPRDSVSNPS